MLKNIGDLKKYDPPSKQSQTQGLRRTKTDNYPEAKFKNIFVSYTHINFGLSRVISNSNELKS